MNEKTHLISIFSYESRSLSSEIERRRLLYEDVYCARRYGRITEFWYKIWNL
jgi:hypothetical protein